MPQIHRNEPEACPTSPRPPGTAKSGVQGCKSDAECKDDKKGKNGRCNMTGGGHALEINECQYDHCFADADCANGGACICDLAGNYCLPGTCRRDADCGAGGACSPVQGCFGVEGYSCHTAKDECIDDDECVKGDSYRRCRYQGELGHWACVDMHCPVG